MPKTTPRLIPLDYRRTSPQEQRARLDAFVATMQRRRTVRDFSPESVPFALIETAIRAAASRVTA